MWRTFFRGRAETVFGPLGLILAVIGSIASAAFIFIALFVPPAFGDLEEVTGTLTRQPQLRTAARRSPWLELAVKERQEVLVVQHAEFLDDHLLRGVMSLSPGAPLKVWVEPGLPREYSLIWQLQSNARSLGFADFIRAHRAGSLHYLKFTGACLAIGLGFLGIEAAMWRRRRRAELP